MPAKISDVPNWIWATIVGLGTVIGVITGMMAVWNQITNNTQTAIETATILITTEIHSQTHVIAEFFEDDLSERIIILETENNTAEKAGLPVPPQKIYQLKSMKERLGELKGRDK